MVKIKLAGPAPGRANFDPGDFLQSQANGGVPIPGPKGHVFYAQGDTADSVFFVISGKIKVAVVSPQGKEAIIALLDANDLLGEGCLIGQPKRLATATALTECRTIRFPRQELQRLLRESPSFAEYFISRILARSARIEEDLVDQLFNSTEKRLARILLLLANFGKEGRPEPVIAKISQEVLAEMIGTTRSRVSHFMSKFRRLGFISYGDGLEVHSSLLSVVLGDQSRDVASRE